MALHFLIKETQFENLGTDITMNSPEKNIHCLIPLSNCSTSFKQGWLNLSKCNYFFYTQTFSIIQKSRISSFQNYILLTQGVPNLGAVGSQSHYRAMAYSELGPTSGGLAGLRTPAAQLVQVVGQSTGTAQLAHESQPNLSCACMHVCASPLLVQVKLHVGESTPACCSCDPVPLSPPMAANSQRLRTAVLDNFKKW